MKKVKNTETPTETAEQPVAETEAPAVVIENKITKVGGLLKEMRLQKGLRLPDIAKRLCIRKDYLEAIEESNYAEMPAFPYGVGFVRSYANYLGLNSGNIVELYKDETTPKSDKDIYVLEPQSEAGVPSKKYLLISLLAIIVVYAGWSAYNSRGDAEDAAAPAEVVAPAEEIVADEMPIMVEDFSAEAVMETPEEATATTDAASQITVTDAKFVEPAVEPQAAEENAPAILAKGVVINVKEETWVEVKDADRLYLSKVLQAGDSYTVPEGKGMILSVGKLNGVDVVINGVVTKVVRPGKRTNIALDPFLDTNH